MNEIVEANSSDLHRYVYIVAISNGTLKVGQTKDPARRIADHARTAQICGCTITRQWVSPDHRNYDANERTLIEFCAERWPRISGVEYFSGGDFDAAVEYAQGLEYATVTAAEIERRQDGANRIVDAVTDLWRKDAGAAEVAQLNERMQIVASLANEQNSEHAEDMAVSLAEEMMRLAPAPWAVSDPTAAERYLAGRGALPGLAVTTAAEFETRMRALYGIRYGRPATAFEDIARYADSVAGVA